MKVVKRGPMVTIPTSLFKPGARGRAEASYIIDSSGQVDPLSTVILASTATAWSVAVCRVLPRILYAPIHENGVPVRARMTQVFEYHVDEKAITRPPPM